MFSSGGTAGLANTTLPDEDASLNRIDPKHAVLDKIVPSITFTFPAPSTETAPPWSAWLFCTTTEPERDTSPEPPTATPPPRRPARFSSTTTFVPLTVHWTYSPPPSVPAWFSSTRVNVLPSDKLPAPAAHPTPPPSPLAVFPNTRTSSSVSPLEVELKYTPPPKGAPL